MIEVGRLCVKTAGRDAGEYCVVVEVIDDKYVLIDGNTRRKKVNKAHIEPLAKVLGVKKGVDSSAVKDAFEKAGIAVKIKGETRTPKKQERKADKKKSDKDDSKKRE